MKHCTGVRVLSLILPALILVACTMPGPVTPTAAPSGNVVTIGFTTSMSGRFTNESSRQVNGLLLWMEQVNNNGGLRLGNGKYVTFDYRTYDDKSNTATTENLYEKLILEDKVAFLFGPYSDELTEAALIPANLNSSILISAGAPSDKIFQNYHLYGYQVYSPASDYLVPTLDILTTYDQWSRRIGILYANSDFGSSAAFPLSVKMREKGLNVVYLEIYEPGTTDFSPFIKRLKTAMPEVIMAGGTVEEGNLIHQELEKQEVEAKFITLLGAPAEQSFGEWGEQAIGIMGPSQWEPESIYPENPLTSGWYGPTAMEFVLTYQAAYGEKPDQIAAGGYTAGLMLQYAIETSGSIDPSLVQSTLDNADLSTFFGTIQFDQRDKYHGTQIGHELLYVQWQQNTEGKIEKKIVWPLDLAISVLVHPVP